MRFISFTQNGKTHKNAEDIQRLLAAAGFGWLLRCEFDSAQLEVRNGVLLWHAGVFYWGDWRWGIFLGGEWRSGHWRGGVWQGGAWKGGNWHTGAWKSGTGQELAGAKSALA